MRKTLKILKLTPIFMFVFIFGSFFFSTNIKAADPIATVGIQCGLNTAPDANCRCPIDQCRLSKFGGASFAERISGRQVWAPDDYGCFREGYKLNNQPEANPYKGTVRLNSIDKTTSDLGLDILGRQLGEAGGERTGADIPFYTDEYTSNPVNLNIPYGSVCKVTDGVAYWYHENYFALVGGTRAAACTPILVSEDLFGEKVTGTDTFFGCLPNSFSGAIAFVVRLVVGIAGTITFLIVMINLIKILSNSNNAEAIGEARKKMVSAIVTLVFILLSLTILSILGLQILNLGDFGGGILSIFTGQ